MLENKAEYIQVETPPGTRQTLPVEPEKRFPASEISISVCDVKDVDKIVSFQIPLSSYPPSFLSALTIAYSRSP